MNECIKGSSKVPWYTPPTNSGAPPAATSLDKKKDKKEKKSGFFGGIFGKKDDDVDDLIISEPTNFRHASSIGWDPVNGFQVLHWILCVL